MKLQRSTVVLVGVALLMGAGVLIAESQRPSTPDETVNQPASPIFAFAETDVTRLTVERQEETLAFEIGEDGLWQMTQPQPGPAEPGAVAFLLSRLNTDSPLETVTMAPDQVADFGFSPPAGTVMVTLLDGAEHTLILGGPDFSGSARYAIIDPATWPPSSTSTDAPVDYKVLVVNQDVANGINRPLAEWQMPVDGGTEETPAPDPAGLDLEAPEAPEAPIPPAGADEGAEKTN